MKKLGLLIVLLGFTTTIACGDDGNSSTDGPKDTSTAADAHDASLDRTDATPADGSTADRGDAVATDTQGDRVDALPSEQQSDAATADVGVDAPADVAPTDAAPADVAPADGGTGDGSTDAVTPTFTVGGTITGLTGTGLVLRDNGGNDLTVAANATAFTFTTRIAQGGAYAVTVQTQPTGPAQNCVVATGTGTVAAANVTNVAITCTTRTFTVGGTITGLVGTGLVLRDNGGDNLTVAANATTFTFATPVASGAAYAVTVLTQPSVPTQSCVVTSGTGTVAAANVAGVSIACTTTSFAVGGTITGLVAPGLVLQDKGGDNLTVAANATTFAFATPVASNASYLVTIFSQPTGQTCTLSTPGGTVGGAAVTSVGVTCVNNSGVTYTVGGTVTGLGGTVVLRNTIQGGTEDRTLLADGSFVFATALAPGASYAVTVFTQPTGQSCVVTNGAGTISAANITNVTVTCTNTGTSPLVFSTETVFGPHGGVGDTAFNEACPLAQGQVLIGLQGHAGGLVDQIQPVCGTLNIVTDTTTTPTTYTVTVTAGSTLPAVGGSGGTTLGTMLMCDTNQIVTAIVGSADPTAHVDSIGVICSTVGVSGDHLSLTTGQIGTLGPIGFMDDTTPAPFMDMCPANAIVTRLFGGYGTSGTPALATAVVENVGSACRGVMLNLPP